MLVISIKVGESIRIDDKTIITLIEKWTGGAVLQVETDRIITIDGTKPKTCSQIFSPKQAT
jgi:sRNA-binding carbon storage regulator CsrA